ncbi:dirigent protein 22-like [Chenopodium quinoa]|nr:dirigent protein 22-like [Chenopodium quinoa]
MTKVTIYFFTFLVFTSCMVNLSYATTTQNPTTSTWAETKSYGRGYERKTVLQFYFHDIRTAVSVEPTTASLIAQPIQGSNNFTSGFGNLYMVDDPLTLTPDRNSKLVGRAQGFYGSASQQVVNFVTGLTYGFVDGIYNGSSLVIFGSNPIANPVRELPVVGGTGVFRMARGYAIARTYFHNNTLHNAIVGYNVTVFHA